MRTAVLQAPLARDRVDDATPGLFCIPSDAHILAGYRRSVFSGDYPEKLRTTYLIGKLYVDMSKEEIRYHATPKTEIARVVANLNEEVDFGNLFVNGVLVTNETADISNNPDMVAVLWKSLERNLVHYVAHGDREVEIVGSPDWAMEIVSDSSVTKDTQQLRLAYHRAGIREYWIVYARGEEISFIVLHWRRTGYVAATHRDGWVRSRVFQRQFRLTRKHDRRGAWKYRLDVK